MTVHKLLDPENRTAFQERVVRDLDVAEKLLQSGAFARAPKRRVGIEQEVQLIGRDSRPACIGGRLGRSLPRPTYQQEFSRFTFEVALPPQEVGPDFLSESESRLRTHIATVRSEAAAHDARPILCGILPSLRRQDIGEAALTQSRRYELLHEVRQEARGGGFEYHVRGIDELVLPDADRLLLDGVFTSLQLHWQLKPETAAEEYNWSQLIAAPCLAAACCSPIFLGKRLWHETRITLFQQASDLRKHELRSSGDDRARATLGHGWIRNILDVWREEVAEYVPHIGIKVAEDPQADFERGDTPKLSHLQFFNSTVYRWNRLCYASEPEREATLRVEGRALPAGLTIVDQLANAALWWGLMAAGPGHFGRTAQRLPFARVRESFRRAARDGMESQLAWKDGEIRPTDRLLLDELLPLAKAGLETVGVPDAERWLAPVEARARSRRTASRWMLDSYEALLADYDADASAVYLTEAIAELAASDTPVSEWPLRERRMHVQDRPIQLRCGDSIELALHRIAWEQAEELSIRTASGEIIGVGRRDLEQARLQGLATVGEAVALRTGGMAPVDAETSIDAFGWNVPLRRILYRKSSARAGPLLVILAGLHGNELNGVASAMCFGDGAEAESGEIVALLGNLPALRRCRRFLDHDLNRTFCEDGWAEDSPEGREASLLWTVLEQLGAEDPKRERWLVDLHGTSGHSPPYLSALSDRSAWPLLDELPVPKALGFEGSIRGTLVEYAARRGWKAATFELGALSAPVSVTNGVAILQWLSDALGIVSLAPHECARARDALASQSWTQAAYEFVYRHPITPEDEFAMLPGFVSFQALREGEHVGNDRNGPVLAPCDGLILMPLYQAQGESGFYVVAPAAGGTAA